MKGKLHLPKKRRSKGDHAVAVSKSIAGAFPFVGPALNELIEAVLLTPAQRRHMEWQTAVTDTINQLIESVDGLSAESLSHDEDFLSALVAASNSAMKTSRHEKIKMLQATLFHTGSGKRLQDFIRSTFFQIVDRYTPEHVALLRAFEQTAPHSEAFERLRIANPDAIKSHAKDGESCNVEDIARYMVPEIEPETAIELFSDLHRDRLCNGSEGFALTYNLNLPPIVITERGRAFLEFVTLD